MKKTKKILCLLLSLLMLMSLGLNTAYAQSLDPVSEDYGVMPTANTLIKNLYGTLETSGFTATITASYSAASQTDSVVLDIFLQKKQSDGTYETIQRWTQEYTTLTNTLTVTATISPFSAYRIRVVGTFNVEPNYQEVSSVIVYE